MVTRTVYEPVEAPWYEGSVTFDPRDLAVPVVCAPMAGGVSTPELVAAVSTAGGLGALPAGYLTADTFGGRVADVRALTSGPISLNLFVPGPRTGDEEQITSYARSLGADAARVGAPLGDPRWEDDAWSAKLEVVLDSRPEAVTFTFGLPSAEEHARLRHAGIATGATVTTLDEARRAVALGVDHLVAQGPDAGGHRGTFDPLASPAVQSLDDLLADVVPLGLPVVAAGGLADAADVDRVLAAGAVAAQLGTAFLLADEAGTRPAHRDALGDPRFTETAVTKAFSGRWARGLRNRFIDEHDADAPLAYPQVHHLTSPLRAAAAAAGDPEAVHLWAGTGWRHARAAPARDVVAALAP